jgi:hypothetical protein
MTIFFLRLFLPVPRAKVLVQLYRVMIKVYDMTCTPFLNMFYCECGNRQDNPERIRQVTEEPGKNANKVRKSFTEYADEYADNKQQTNNKSDKLGAQIKSRRLIPFLTF